MVEGWLLGQWGRLVVAKQVEVASWLCWCHGVQWRVMWRGGDCYGSGIIAWQSWANVAGREGRARGERRWARQARSLMGGCQAVCAVCRGAWIGPQPGQAHAATR